MQRRSAYYGALTGTYLTPVGASSGGAPPAPVIDPLTAARSIDLGSRNGLNGRARYLEMDAFDWHFGKTGLQYGMFAFWAQLDKGSLYPVSPATSLTGNPPTQYAPMLHSNSANATTGALSCGYFPEGAPTVAYRSRIYLRMQAGTPSAATLFRVSPVWADDRPRLVAIRCTAAGIYISLVEAGGTSVQNGAAANPGGGSTADSGTYNGNSNGAVAVARPRLGAVTGTLTPTFAQCFSGQLSGFLLVRNNREVTDAELIQLANGVDPATIFSGADLGRYHRLGGPTDLARTAGTDAGTAAMVATTVGDIPIRAGASLCPVTDGTKGGYMLPLPDGYVAGVNPASVGPRPMPVTIINTGAASHWEARAVEEDGETVVTNWTQITASPIATGATLVTELPGVLPNTGKNIIEARPVGTTLAVAGRRCGVGIKVPWDGQSQEAICQRSVATDAGVLAATVPGPDSNVTFVCATGYGAGDPNGNTDFRRAIHHRIVQSESDAGEAVKAFAKKWTAEYPRALACVISPPTPGTGRNIYYADTASGAAAPGSGTRPDLYPTGTEPYRYFGDYVTEGSGVMTDLMLKAGKDISAFYGYYSTDDLGVATSFAGIMATYFSGADQTGNGYGLTGAPARHWGGMGLVHPLLLRVSLHDRIIAVSGSNLATIQTTALNTQNRRTVVRAFIASNPAWATVRMGTFHPDKSMQDATQSAHQGQNLLSGSARMGEQRVHMMAHDMGLTTYNPESVPVAATVSGGTVTVTFTLANGGSLATVGGGSTVKGFEVSTNGGTTWTSTDGTLSGNAVVLAGTWAAGNLVQYARGGPINNATPPMANAAAAYAQDNLDLDCLLIETRADMSGTTAPGVPIMPAASALVAA
jgi:hypothetical protein